MTATHTYLPRHATTCLFALGLLAAVPVAAQQGPMGQGQAAINVRSDVTMAIRGTRGTPKERLQALGEVVMGKMPDVRGCYRELVAKRPTTVGAFEVTVVLDAGPTAELSVREQGGSDAQLKKCVMHRLAQARFGGVDKPASAVVTLRFDNSRAEGQAAFEQVRAELDEVEVVDAEDGSREASWHTHDKRVYFVARAARGKRRDAAVESAIRAVREGYAAFLDCRRRATKGGLSPAGKIAATVRLQARGRGDASLGEVTVAHERAPNCARRAFRKLRYPDAPVGARVDLTVRFSE